MGLLNVKGGRWRSSGGGAPAPSPAPGTPQWVTDLSTLTWAQIPSSNLSAAYADIPIPVLSGGGDVGTPGGVMAFSGGTMKASGSEIFIFGGGHGDWAGNEVYSMRLADEAPAWDRRTDPSSPVQSNVSHYSDGLPSSRHTYNTVQYIDVLDRMMTFGVASAFGASGSAKFNCIDAFDPNTNTWAAAGTYANGPNLNEYELGIGRDDDGYVYVHNAANRFVKWNPNTDTWSDLAAGGNSIVDGELEALCHDSTRNRIMSFGFPRGWYDPSTGAFTEVTLTGAAASTVNTRGAGTSWVYCPDRDSYLGWQRGQNAIYECDASTFVVTTLSLGGTAPPAAYYGNAYDKLYNRLMYSRDLKLLVAVLGATLNVYCFKVA